MSAAYTKAELAHSLHCGIRDAYERADKLGIPFDLRDGVRANGDVFYYRVYLKELVDRARAAYADELGRIAARKKAS